MSQLFRIRRFTKYWRDLKDRFSSFLSARRSDYIWCHTFVFVVVVIFKLSCSCTSEVEFQTAKRLGEKMFHRSSKDFNEERFLPTIKKYKVTIRKGSLRNFGFWVLSTTGKYILSTLILVSLRNRQVIGRWHSVLWTTCG